MSVTRRTKIVATLGPASDSPDVMGRLFDAGVDVVRLNLSHGTLDEHHRRLETARRVASDRGLPVGVLADLPGPKLRVGNLPDGQMTLQEGQEVVLATGQTVLPGVIPVVYPSLIHDVAPGDRIFMQDGEIALTVIDGEASGLRCVVESGGVLRERTGVNLPGVWLSVPAVTDSDLRLLAWASTHGIEFVGLSFVESAAEVEQARQVVARSGGACSLVAKIERQRALDRLDAIVAAADAVMVARGDLAVETAIDEVPIVQKSIIALCNRLGRPVITATQMLESMITRARPTRAEAADVANAVLDGTDALMLSGETAIGAHPVEAVATMAAIAARADAARPYQATFAVRSREIGPDTSEAIALAACEAAEAIDAAAIVAATESGSTARRVSRLRPRRPIVAITSSAHTWRQLSVVWGVRPVLIEPAGDVDALVAQGVRAARALGVARPGDQVVVTAGIPIGQPGTTNFLKVIRIE
jgi:pyruvate kinase